jgi:hypothetical protein
VFGYKSSNNLIRLNLNLSLLTNFLLKCIDNLNYSTVLQNTTTSSEVNMPNVEKHSVDSKLFKDDNDVKYCKTLNSCKVPQVSLHETKSAFLSHFFYFQDSSCIFRKTFRTSR